MICTCFPRTSASLLTHACADCAHVSTPRQGDGDIYAAEETTIVDKAREWVEGCAAAHPALEAALADGAVQRAATRAVQRWREAWLQSVSDLRRSDAVVHHRAASHVHRTSVSLLRSLVTKHSTFAVFLSEPLDGLQARVCASSLGAFGR